MKKLLTILFLLNLIGLSALAQDTITVQTLTFDSITTRRGIWNFPEGNDYRKVLMHYTLKCDAATAHDQYYCGEWDYLTYTTLYEHTQQYDSTLYHQDKYQLLSGDAPDEIQLTDQIPYEVYGTTYQQMVFGDITSTTSYELVADEAVSGEVLATDYTDGRTRFIVTAEELVAAGMSSGVLSGINLHVDSPGSNLKTLMIRLSHQSTSNVGNVSMLYDADTVYYAPYEMTDDEWMSIDFEQAFSWNGSSNILVDISFSNENPGEPTILKGYEESDEAMFSQVNHTENYTVKLDGESDYLEMKPNVYFNGEYTYEVWLKKTANNNWSRVIDFGNGPGEDNVIIALSNSTSGNLSFHIYSSAATDSYTLEQDIPLNEWIHIGLRSMYGVQGFIFINGEYVQNTLLRYPDSVQRNNCYIGRSNWESNAYAGVEIDEMRLYDYSRSDDEMYYDMYHSIENPQDEDGLVFWLDFNEPDVDQVQDLSGNGNYATRFGFPTWTKRNGHQKARDFERIAFRPDIVFERVVSSNNTLNDIVVYDTMYQSQTQYMVFGAEDPTVVLDTLSGYFGDDQNVYLDGEVVGTNSFSISETLVNEQLPYYGEPFEVVNNFELARFITPYGINLDLGDEGFTWIYDITDYANLLQGEVDLSAGNQQELIDLKFEFITGTPPRDVVQIQRPWGYRASRTYANLDDDVYLSDTLLTLHDETVATKIKTRLTGHGHQSTSGDYPHCCEWKDNTHYLLNNGETVAEWHIWKEVDCAANPVYPQGGTWLGAREGWCPGDKVDDFEFELTDYIQNGQLDLDYDITPVPDYNVGMGNGNYVISMHLVEYGTQNFSNDAEVYEIIVPGSTDEYQRKNPVCNDPTIVIRNNGAETLESLTITYGIIGGAEQTYQWTGSLAPNYKEQVVLPVANADFWVGDGSNEFYATVSQPNGTEDMYADNNTAKQYYTLPDLINEPFQLKLYTNSRPEDFDLTVTDLYGNVVFERHDFEASTLYSEIFNLEEGCYTLLLTDSEYIGLYYWAYTSQGSGYMRMYNAEGQIIKSFEPEFGHEIRYSFSVGSQLLIQEPNLDNLIEVGPNPTDGEFTINVNGIYGETFVKIYDAKGNPVLEKSVDADNGILTLKENLSGHSKGMYLVKIINAELTVSKKIILK